MRGILDRVDRMLYAFVEGIAGAITRALPIERGTTAHVWCVDTAHGRLAVKRHGRGRAFSQEVAALGALPVADDDAWPRLVACDPDALVIVTTWLAGRPVDATAPSRVFAAAGALARRLAAVPCPVDDPLPLADALARRMTAMLADAALAPELAERVRAAWRPDAFVNSTRAFCHRDFAPHNWIVDDATLRVVDFGHARADHPLVDLARALSPVWGRPQARADLLAGYGLDAAHEDALRGLELLDLVATAAWARRNDDAALATRADAAVEAMLG